MDAFKREARCCLSPAAESIISDSRDPDDRQHEPTSLVVVHVDIEDRSDRGEY